MNSKTVTVVSGLARSGTSLPMQMLEKGGLSPLTDNKRQADENNPNGYYSHQDVMNLQKNPTIIEQAVNKSVKVLAALLPQLPEGYHYKIIFIQRDLEEIWPSQQKVLKSLGRNIKEGVFSIRQREKYKQILERAKTWIEQQAHVDVLYIHYQQLIEKPLEQAQQINDFLGNHLSTPLMASVVAPHLYHQRGAKNFLVTDRSPLNLAPLIEKYAKGKTFCEIGIGEGHLLHKVQGTQNKFGVEKTLYGVQRCKELYPELEIKHNNFLDIVDEVTFEVCYYWITFPFCEYITKAILKRNENAILIIGLNYFFHLNKEDPKAQQYFQAYTSAADAENWNTQAQQLLDQLKSQNFQIQVRQVEAENKEVFSVAIVQKMKFPI